MFEYLFKEKELSEKVVFVKDLEMDLESGLTIFIPKGTKGDKVKELKGRFETTVEIMLDKPIKIRTQFINSVRVKKDFSLIDNAS